jgi:cytochrome P450
MNPDQRALLAATPRLARAVTDEVIRFDSPVQLTGRFVVREIEFGGTRLAPGAAVLIALGSANRDQDVFADPDRIDIRRNLPAPALGLGGGIHHCLGRALARLEGEAIFPAFAAMLPGAVPADNDVSYRKTAALRALRSLRVRVA